MNTINCDLLIIGGGAAGLTAAISASEHKDLKIVIAESNARVGKKLAVTGNGRCNITNKNLHKDNYYGDKDFAFNIFDKFGYFETLNFFDKIGVIIKTEANGKAYPYSLQATSVVDALRFECDRRNIKTILNCTIDSIDKNEGYFTAKSKDYNIKAKSIICAFGGKAGGSLYGTDGNSNKLISKWHKLIEQSPVIVQIKTDNTITKRLKGIKVNAKVTICNKKDFGEVLFCEYGLSGPPILQLSRFAKEGDYVYLDIMPEFSIAEIINLLEKRKGLERSKEEFFTGLINKKVGLEIIKSYNGNLSSQALAEALKNFKFKITGTTGFKNAQATSGGFCTSEFTLGLESIKVPRLFCCGELLNVDGDCGGYNLQWAFSSGFIAGKSAYKSIKGK